MTVDAWITVAVITTIFALLVGRKYSPGIIFLGAVTVLLATGVIDFETALDGLSNPAPIAVGALYVVAAAVSKTGALGPLVAQTLGDSGSGRRPMIRLVSLTMGASAFLNNTPVVAVLIPQVTGWAERHKLSASRFLMPISFAAILGGLITVIGTSTNLVVSGGLEQAGYGAIGFFEITKVGVFVAIAGGLTISILAPRLLPDRRSLTSEVEEGGRAFSIDMTVDPGGPIDGRTVQEAALRNLTGVFLASIDRGDTTIAPVRPETVLRGGNRLTFVGKADHVLDLLSVRGLSSTESQHIMGIDDPMIRYFEVVIGPTSGLKGRTLAEVGFRSTYQAAVLAIHRAGALVDSKLGAERLRVGDTLIVLADPDFDARWRDRADFLLIAEMKASPIVTTRASRVVFVVLVFVVLGSAAGVIPIATAALIGALALVVTGVLAPEEAYRSLDLDVLFVIAAAFGVASAVGSTGLADLVASSITSAFDWAGPRGVLFGLILSTIILTELMTNNAAALLMLPIALAAAGPNGLDPRGAAIAIAIAASASFLTPVGYQTNMMVFGPGNYRVVDYARLGLPLTLIVVATAVWAVPVFWPA